MLKKLLSVSILFLLTSTFISAQGWYLGVYNPNVTACSNCHGTTITAWEATGHAKAQDSVAALPFYKFRCLECHNTGWDTGITNGGADEFVMQDTTLNPDYVITDQTRWDLVKNVQCEACHDPIGTAENTMDFGHTTPGARITDFKAQNCGDCHQDSHHPYMEEWSASGHASGAPVWLNRSFAGGSCMYCHFTQDFIAFLEDPSYNGATFVPEGDAANNEFIDCVACHDPHGNNNPGNLRTPVSSVAVICDECHTVHTDSVDVNDTPHHTTSEVLSGAPNFGYQYPGQTYENSAHTSVATERCVDCHVHMTPFSGAPAVTGHTFEPRVESCARADCHGDAYYTMVDTSNADARFDLYGTQTTIDSLMGELQSILDGASSLDSLTDAFKQARYNLLAIEAEGSHGIHNTKLVKKLLMDAIAMPVPVELTSFTAAHTGTNVILEWTTATELNNSGFDIERRVDNSAWMKIGFVEGNGTTSELSLYSFSDDISSLAAQTIYYRLKQIDYDGTFEYSHEVQIADLNLLDYSLSQNYPNPFNPATTIKFTIPTSANVKLIVYDALGELVAVLVNDQLEAGSFELQWNGNNHASGIYFYKIETEDFVDVKKMLLIK